MNETNNSEPAILQFIDAAAALSDSVSDLDQQGELMSLVSSAYAAEGYFDAAEDIVGRIRDPYTRDRTLGMVAARAVMAGDNEFADKLVNEITDDSLYALALHDVAVAHAERGQFDQALEVASEVADNAATLSSIAVAYARNSDFENAVDVALSIEYPDIQTATHIQIAGQAISNGVNDEGRELLSRAENSIKDIPLAKERADALLAVASLFRTLGENEKALELLNEVRRTCEENNQAQTDGFPSGFALDQTLASLSLSYSTLGRFGDVREVVDEIEDAFQFALAVANAANEYVAIGDNESAKAFLGEGLEAIEDEPIVDAQALHTRDEALAQTALCYAKMVSVDDASRVVEQIEGRVARLRAVFDVSRSLAISGGADSAIRFASKVENPSDSAKAHIVASLALREHGDTAGADDAFGRAVSISDQIEDPHELATVHAELDFRLNADPENEDAHREIGRALQATREIPNLALRGHTLLFLGKKVSESDLALNEQERAVLEEMIATA